MLKKQILNVYFWLGLRWDNYFLNDFIEVRGSPLRRYWSLGAMGTGAGPDSRVVGVVGVGGGFVQGPWSRPWPLTIPMPGQYNSENFILLSFQFQAPKPKFSKSLLHTMCAKYSECKVCRSEGIPLAALLVPGRDGAGAGPDSRVVGGVVGGGIPRRAQGPGPGPGKFEKKKGIQTKIREHKNGHWITCAKFGKIICQTKHSFAKDLILDKCLGGIIQGKI